MPQTVPWHVSKHQFPFRCHRETRPLWLSFGADRNIVIYLQATSHHRKATFAGDPSRQHSYGNHYREGVQGPEKAREHKKNNPSHPKKFQKIALFKRQWQMVRLSQVGQKNHHHLAETIPTRTPAAMSGWRLRHCLSNHVGCTRTPAGRSCFLPAISMCPATDGKQVNNRTSNDIYLNLFQLRLSISTWSECAVSCGARPTFVIFTVGVFFSSFSLFLFFPPHLRWKCKIVFEVCPVCGL